MEGSTYSWPSVGPPLVRDPVGGPYPVVGTMDDAGLSRVSIPSLQPRIGDRRVNLELADQAITEPRRLLILAGTVVHAQIVGHRVLYRFRDVDCLFGSPGR